MIKSDAAFRGVFPVLHTPFTEQGDVDEESFIRQVDFCVDGNVGGLVFPSFASEFFTLTDAERRRLAELLVTQTAGRRPAVVGVSDATARGARALAEHAASIGADAVLAMPQYPRQGPIDSVIEYFTAISAGAPGLPIILQNPREPVGTPISGVNLKRLLDAVPTVRYIKEEAVPSGTRVTNVLAEFGKSIDGVFGGYFGLSHVQDVVRGACGVMPGVALVEFQSEIQELLDAGETDRAYEAQAAILPILQYLSVYSSAAHKELMVRVGVFSSAYVRAPHAPRFDQSHRDEIVRLMAQSPMRKYL